MQQTQPPPFTLVSANLKELLDAAPPADERLKTQRIFQGEGATMVRLTFAAGQEMREHSTNSPLIVQVIAGDVRFNIGDEDLELTTGSILHVAPGIRHALEARTEAHLLLTLCMK